MSTVQKKKDLSSHDTMKLFDDSKFKALVAAAVLIKEPLVLQNELNTKVVHFLQYVDNDLPEQRDFSTGRPYKIRSDEASTIFGDKMIQLLYKITNKLNGRMANSISATNNTILWEMMVFMRKMLAKYVLERPAQGTTQTSEDDNKEQDINETSAPETNQGVKPTNAKTVVEVSTKDLENAVLQYVCRFLSCFVQVTQRKTDSEATKSPRRKRVVHGAINSQKKKTSDFIDKMVVGVLNGDQSLLDQAGQNRYVQQTYHQRDTIRESSAYCDEENIVGQFQSVAFGYRFPETHSRLNIGKQTRDFALTEQSFFQQRQFFMRIGVDTVQTDKCIKIQPRWQDDTNFIEFTVLTVKEHTESLVIIIERAKELFCNAYDENVENGKKKEKSNDDSTAEGDLKVKRTEESNDDTTSEAELKAFVEDNIFIQVNEDGAFILDTSKFLLRWTRDDTLGLPELEKYTEQPSLSVKLAILSKHLTNLIKKAEDQIALCERSDIQQYYFSLLLHEASQAFTGIMNAVRTSDINTAMVACLNHNGFQTINPLRDPITHEFHQSFKATSSHVGIHAMAFIAQAGFAFFEQHLLRIYTSFGARPKKDKDIAYDEDRDDDDTIADTTSLTSALLTLEKNAVLPTIADLMPFLKKAFSGMPKEDLALFQSILMDIWVLQPWTRRLDYREERLITKMEQRPPAGDFEEEENEDGEKNEDDEKTFASLIFETIETSQVQSAVNANGGTPQSSEPSAVNATPSIPKSSKTSTSSSVSSIRSKTPISALKTMRVDNDFLYTKKSTVESTPRIGKKSKQTEEQEVSYDDEKNEDYNNEDRQQWKKIRVDAIEKKDEDDSDDNTVDSKDEDETNVIPNKTSTKNSSAATTKKTSEGKLKKAAQKPNKTAGKGKHVPTTAESSKGKATTKKNN